MCTLFKANGGIRKEMEVMNNLGALRFFSLVVVGAAVVVVYVLFGIVCFELATWIK